VAFVCMALLVMCSSNTNSFLFRCCTIAGHFTPPLASYHCTSSISMQFAAHDGSSLFQFFLDLAKAYDTTLRAVLTLFLDYCTAYSLLYSQERSKRGTPHLRADSSVFSRRTRSLYSTARVVYCSRRTKSHHNTSRESKRGS